MDSTEYIHEAEFTDALPGVSRRGRRPAWRDRSFGVLIGVFVLAFAIACASIYYLLVETQRSTLNSVFDTLQRQEGSADAQAEQPRSVNDHTVAIPNCGPDQAFSAYPERELVVRTVHVFDCGSTRYILMPPVEGR